MMNVTVSIFVLFMVDGSNGSCCILQILQLVLHLIKMEKCLYTMDLKAVG